MSCLLYGAAEHTTAGASSHLHWYAANTYPRHEKTVHGYLNAKSFEVFLPTVITRSQWKDRTKQLSSPAFPGYIFVRIPLHQRGEVLSVPGVVRILSFNGTPAPIQDAEIDAIRVCLKGTGRVEPYPFLVVGEPVRVISGALQGLEGFVIRKKGGCRLVLSISLIHQSVAVEIDASALESLRPSAIAAKPIATIPKASLPGRPCPKAGSRRELTADQLPSTKYGRLSRFVELSLAGVIPRNGLEEQVNVYP